MGELWRGIALGLVAVVGWVGLAPAVAVAQDEEKLPTLASPVVCLKADFPVLGSGWKVHAAASVWNERQSIIRFTFTPEPGCADVIVHHYYAPPNNTTLEGQCAYTTWDRLWPQRVLTSSGTYEVVGADIYLNDGCVGNKRLTRRIVAHELGHVMGLPHVDDLESVMCSCVLYPLTRSNLVAPVDVSSLLALYAG